MLFGSTSKVLYDLLLAAFDKYFTYTTRTGTELSFLNYRIIQSEWGISIDQTTHIRQNILAKYFPDKTMKVPFQSSPFPLDNGVEMKIFEATDLSDKELSELAKIHRGGYSTWAGALLHIAVKSRPDLSYATMRLTGYNSTMFYNFATNHGLFVPSPSYSNHVFKKAGN